MDLNNYIRLLEDENRRLKERLTLSQESPPVRTAPAETLPVAYVGPPLTGRTAVAGPPPIIATAPVVPSDPPIPTVPVVSAVTTAPSAVDVNGKQKGPADPPLPYQAVLKPHYPGLGLMHPRQQEKVEAAVRGYLLSRLPSVPVVGKHPAVPPELHGEFLYWFAKYNEAENIRKEAERGRREAETGGGEPGSSGSAAPTVGRLLAWTDLIRSVIPGITLLPKHSTFTSVFCSKRGCKQMTNASSGMVTMGIPEQLVGTYVEEFKSTYLPLSCEDSPVSDAGDGDYRPRKRVRTRDGAEKRVYWTDLIKQWDGPWYDSLGSGQRLRLREAVREYLRIEVGEEAGLKVPETHWEGLRRHFLEIKPTVTAVPAWEEEVVSEGQVQATTSATQLAVSPALHFFDLRPITPDDL